jgi:hypothetical protein
MLRRLERVQHMRRVVKVERAVGLVEQPSAPQPSRRLPCWGDHPNVGRSAVVLTSDQHGAREKRRVPAPFTAPRSRPGPMQGRGGTSILEDRRSPHPVEL